MDFSVFVGEYMKVVNLERYGILKNNKKFRELMNEKSVIESLISDLRLEISKLEHKLFCTKNKIEKIENSIIIDEFV